ncbi:hypothetical protein U1Q18_026121 [Sarracenia purpurea var. burkii]
MIGEEDGDRRRTRGKIQQRSRRVSGFSTDRRNCRGVEEPLRRSRRKQKQRKNHSEDRREEEIQVAVQRHNDKNHEKSWNCFSENPVRRKRN